VPAREVPHRGPPVRRANQTKSLLPPLLALPPATALSGAPALCHDYDGDVYSRDIFSGHDNAIRALCLFDWTRPELAEGAAAVRAGDSDAAMAFLLRHFRASVRRWEVSVLMDYVSNWSLDVALADNATKYVPALCT